LNISNYKTFNLICLTDYRGVWKQDH